MFLIHRGKKKHDVYLSMYMSHAFIQMTSRVRSRIWSWWAKSGMGNWLQDAIFFSYTREKTSVKMLDNIWFRGYYCHQPAREGQALVLVAWLLDIGFDPAPSCNNPLPQLKLASWANSNLEPTTGKVDHENRKFQTKWETDYLFTKFKRKPMFAWRPNLRRRISIWIAATHKERCERFAGVSRAAVIQIWKYIASKSDDLRSDETEKNVSESFCVGTVAYFLHWDIQVSLIICNMK